LGGQTPRSGAVVVATRRSEQARANRVVVHAGAASRRMTAQGRSLRIVGIALYALDGLPGPRPAGARVGT
jgi:hypothetical protein